MMVSLFQWGAVIGIFYCCSSAMSYCLWNLIRNFVLCFESLLFCWHYCESAFIISLTLIYIYSFLQCHGDIELYPGRRKLKINSSICHWNLNSLAAHNFLKLTQLIAYNLIYKHNFICPSETYLDSSIPDNLIDIEGYTLIRADHPDNIKRGGVCIYYKKSLPVQIINQNYLKEALLLEMSYNNKKLIVSVIYCSPSQSTDEFDSFLSNVANLLNDINKRKPSLSVVTGDFNSRSFSWWSRDTNTIGRLKLFSLTSSNGLSQLINEPTHNQANSTSCIDLIFTDQENLSVNSGVHSSLHPNCHHQIVRSSFNLNIYYPSPYQQLVWDYKKANSTTIRKALDSVNWERLFHGKDINAQVTLFNDTILNVFKNYVPNKYITIDDKDPVWMNDNIKAKIKTKYLLF